MITLGVFLGLLPGFAWLAFYLQEDCHPEPKKLIALTFINGAAFAFIALLVQILLDNSLRQYNISYLAPIAIILFSGIEELLKFLAAYSTVHKSPDFDEPVDAMLYLIVAALGFATVENVGIAMGMQTGNGYLTSVFQIITFRFIGATLLHTLTSGIVGYYWAKGIGAFRRHRYIIAGLLTATVLHSIFNILILRFGGGSLLPVIFIAIIGVAVLRGFEKLRGKMV